YLHEHTTLKKENMLVTTAFMAMTNGGAFLFIDAIDPVGTLNSNVYNTMSRVFAHTQSYKKYVGGELVQDAAIYLSTESKCDFADNGKHISQVAASTDSVHINCVMRTTRAFIKNHIPFGIITRKKLDELDSYKVIILPNVLMMSEMEVEAFRNYVARGGRIYASKYTSLVNIEGDFKNDFMLAEVFGANYDGMTDENFTYIAPKGRGQAIMPSNVNEKYPLSIYGNQVRLKSECTAEVLGTLILPYTNPCIPRPFSSIHSNPPGIITGLPAITSNRYGKGRAMYCTGDLENVEFHDEIFTSFIRDLLDDKLSIEGNIPRQVEVTMFNQEGRRTILNFLSFQAEMPNLPIPEFTIRVTTEEDNVKRVLHLPDEREIPFVLVQGYVEFIVEGFDTFTMYAIDFK
ncbi:MAG: beta-galactosidase trimerization domain-containing protein, partial [Clostridiales bacterium]|nr:beta-galactosidase trimerization domain-containing protein [Clostridiales bacterium]